MAVSKLGPQPVAFYAAVFLLMNATYALLIWELINPRQRPMPRVRKVMLLRAITTLCLFAGGSIIALRYPLTGLGMCIACLIADTRQVALQRELPKADCTPSLLPTAPPTASARSWMPLQSAHRH